MKLPQDCRDALRQGLMKVLVLRPDGSPAADSIELVFGVWVEAFEHAPLSWVNDGAERIRQGFISFIVGMRRFPCPAEVLEHISAAVFRQPELPPAPMTEEERQRNKKRLAEIVAALAEKQKMKQNF